MFLRIFYYKFKIGLQYRDGVKTKEFYLHNCQHYYLFFESYFYFQSFHFEQVQVTFFFMHFGILVLTIFDEILKKNQLKNNMQACPLFGLALGITMMASWHIFSLHEYQISITSSWLIYLNLRFSYNKQTYHGDSIRVLYTVLFFSRCSVQIAM